MSGTREDYVAITLAMLRCGKLGLSDHVLGGGSVFAVPKPDGSQRQIIDRRGPNGAEDAVQGAGGAASLLAVGARLTELSLSEDEYLVVDNTSLGITAYLLEH